jgi:hypothetical protein
MGRVNTDVKELDCSWQSAAVPQEYSSIVMNVRLQTMWSVGWFKTS